MSSNFKSIHQHIKWSSQLSIESIALSIDALPYDDEFIKRYERGLPDLSDNEWGCLVEALDARMKLELKRENRFGVMISWSCISLLYFIGVAIVRAVEFDIKTFDNLAFCLFAYASWGHFGELYSNAKNNASVCKFVRSKTKID